MSAGNDREFIDHLQTEEILWKLKFEEALALTRLMVACIRVGTADGVKRYKLKVELKEVGQPTQHGN